MEDISVDAKSECTSICEQKAALIRSASKGLMDTETMMAIGNVLITNDRARSLNICNEGTVINLDTLPHELVTQMYTIMMKSL